MLLAPSKSLLGRVKALGCVCGIKWFVNAGGHRHYRGKVKSGRRTLTDNIKLGIILRRHHITRETERSEFVVNATIASLHGEHPIQVPLDFGEQIRERSFGGDIPLERLEVSREMFVQRKKRVSRDAGIHDIAAIVACIVPALAGINRPRGARRIVKFNGCVRMACSTVPLARILLFQSHRGTLVIEPLDRRLENFFVRLRFHHKIGTEHIAAHLDAVLARFGEFRKIDELDILTTCIPERGRFRCDGEHNLTCGIYEIHIAVRIDKSKFLEVSRTITDLVDVGSSRKRLGGNERGKHHRL